MNLNSTSLCEYLLVLKPHEELRNKIMHVRDDFQHRYKARSAVFSQPQVTLVKFSQQKAFEERIVNRLNMIAMAFHPIKVELKNFGSFPTHTIYINVTSKLPVQELTKQIRSDAQRLMKPDAQNKPLFFLEPHIPVAQKLLPWQYEQGWLEHRAKDFTGRFIADSMLLYRRIKGEGQYSVTEKFEFQNLKISTTQGELFS